MRIPYGVPEFVRTPCGVGRRPTRPRTCYGPTSGGCSSSPSASPGYASRARCPGVLSRRMLTSGEALQSRGGVPSSAGTSPRLRAGLPRCYEVRAAWGGSSLRRGDLGLLRSERRINRGDIRLRDGLLALDREEYLFMGRRFPRMGQSSSSIGDETALFEGGFLTTEGRRASRSTAAAKKNKGTAREVGSPPTVRDVGVAPSLRGVRALRGSPRAAHPASQGLEVLGGVAVLPLRRHRDVQRPAAHDVQGLEGFLVRARLGLLTHFGLRRAGFRGHGGFGSSCGR